MYPDTSLLSCCISFFPFQYHETHFGTDFWEAKINNLKRTNLKPPKIRFPIFIEFIFASYYYFHFTIGATVKVWCIPGRQPPIIATIDSRVFSRCWTMPPALLNRFLSTSICKRASHINLSGLIRLRTNIEMRRVRNSTRFLYIVYGTNMNTFHRISLWVRNTN